MSRNGGEAGVGRHVKRPADVQGHVAAAHVDAQTVAVAAGAMEAGWIASPNGPLFVCHHVPRSATRATAVLLCDPFGSDRMNMHLTYRALAQRLAAAGFPVLRLDYPGTCDSAGSACEIDVERWLEALARGVDWLKARSGTSSVCLFGAQLGGTMAIELARRRGDTTGVCVWGAHASGRAFVRELLAFSALTATNPAGLRPSWWQSDDVEALGFLLPHAMIQGLQALAPKDVPAHVRHAAVFRRNATASVDALVTCLGKHGADVHVQPQARVDMAELVAERALPPAGVLDDMLAWWTKAYPSSGERSIASTQSMPPDERVTLEVADGRPCCERVLRFGRERELFGIVTTPASPGDDVRFGVVLVNGGSNHRVGINRNYTDWARAWAARGYTVLRMDIAGLGDSPPRTPERLGVLYLDETRDDVIAAFDALEHEYGLRRFAAMGLCAGGYQAFHAALADVRVCGVALLNPLRFRRVASSEKGRSEFDYASLSHYAKALRDWGRWRKALQQPRELLGIARSVVTRLLRDMGGRLRGWGAADAQRPGATWLAEAFLRLGRRGCSVLVVREAGEPIAQRFEEELALDRVRLDASGLFATHVLENTDHIFTPLWSQEKLASILNEALAAWAHRSTSEAPDHG